MIDLPYPEKDMRNAANKKAKQEAEKKAKELNNGKGIVITRTFFREVEKIAQIAKETDFFQNYIQKAIIGKEITKEHQGIDLKGTLDLLIPSTQTGVDIKTAHSLAEFCKRILGKGFAYYLQAGVYAILYELQDFYFFAQQTQAPYLCKEFYLSPKTLQVCKERVERLLKKFQKCLDKGFYQEEILLPSFLG